MVLLFTFSTALFVSALLLFCVEPMVAKMLLPLVGGVPAVWATCLVFFQGALLGGYVFSLVTLRVLGPRRQAIVQLIVIVAALVAMPISVDAALANQTRALGPALGVLVVLTRSVGLPFFAVSTIAPTLQRWYSTIDAPRSSDPYFLYAASNAGSLVALLAYPLVLEPRLGLSAQAQVLRVGYFVLVALVGGCVLVTARRARTITAKSEEAVPLTLRQRMRWLALAAIPSAYLVAVTSHVTVDVTPTPFLWALPLAAYLATFVIVFMKTPVISHERIERIAPFVALAVTFVLAVGVSRPIGVVLSVHLGGFFVLAMLCHGALAKERPPPARLVEFYVWMSVGGFVGGLVVALVAPVVLVREIEYPACVVFALLARRGESRSARRGESRAARLDAVAPLVVFVVTAALGIGASHWTIGPKLTVLLPIPAVLYAFRHAPNPRRFAAALGAMMLASAFFPRAFGEVVRRERNFFGALVVAREPQGRWLQLDHGTTVHGLQLLDPSRRREPCAYYSRPGPVGDAFRVFDDDPSIPRRVGVIGLGTGTLAAYARPDERWVFFEINPAVVDIARTDFSYLKDAFPDEGRLDLVVGDARIELASREGGYGMLLVDAFSSDAIPVHLVTEEASALYASKLSDGGMVAWHVSNRVVDLRPVLAAIAAARGWSAWVRFDRVTDEDEAQGRSTSTWVVMSSRADRGPALGPGWVPLAVEPGFVPWTDDRSSIVPLLRP